MSTRSAQWIALAVVSVILVGAVVANQLKVHRGRQARAAVVEQRHALFELIQPVALANCRLERFGEPHDGGYLMCGNLLEQVQSGYSYGIAGYDGWGCDISTRFGITVHQYDCFDTTEPACPGGRTIFHAECVGGTTHMEAGRFFDTIANQVARNGAGASRLVMKIDVEGAEWDSLLALPDDVLQRIDQLAMELHGVGEEKHVRLLERLRRFFEVVHLHFNNASCADGIAPFPAWAYELLLVNKRLAVVDPSRTPMLPHPLDAPTDPSQPDCQAAEGTVSGAAGRADRSSPHSGDHRCRTQVSVWKLRADS
jgi:hypothetical protein